ncbi:MAG TPA: phosphate ABC transporter substrate-binding protein [Xanthobacteraceae bacterium]|jgi:4,5-dihydroxyphthalate decarboxylase|nr:phosphate ABC transporter substrate-binding protein [Xanthobacteraceae bacterium]
MSEGHPVLHTMLGNYPDTAALKTKQLTPKLFNFDFAEVKVANQLFKSLVRDAKYDIGELAIVTFLQAKAYGKPYVLLPAVIVGRGQHHTIAYNPERGHLRPGDLEGKRVGVRAYTVTTGVWVRGILREQYGIDEKKVKWVTFEDPHLAEFHDPPFVERAAPGKTLPQMLLDGELDAVIVGDHMPDPRLAYLIPNPEEEAKKWALSHGGVPINHLVVMRQSVAQARPDIVKEVFGLLHESKLAANLPQTGTALDPLRFGVEPNRQTLDVVLDFAFTQGMIPHRFSVDELFDDTTRNLTA